MWDKDVEEQEKCISVEQVLKNKILVHSFFVWISKMMNELPYFIRLTH